MSREGRAKILTPEQEQRVLEMFVGRHALRDKAMFLFCLYSGMRRNECRQLDVNDVLGRDGSLKKEFLLKKGITKNHQCRKLFMHPIAAGAVNAYIVERAGEGKSLDLNSPLFLSQYGTRLALSTFSRVFEDAFALAGIEGASTHSMRRTHITRLHNNGVPIKVISRLAGHSNIAITSIYIEVTEDEMQSAVLGL